MNSYIAKEQALRGDSLPLLISQTRGHGGMKSRPPRAINVDEAPAGDSSVGEGEGSK